MAKELPFGAKMVSCLLRGRSDVLRNTSVYKSYSSVEEMIKDILKEDIE